MFAWATGDTCPLQLADAGGESTDPAPVRGDAPADLGAPGADRLTDDGGRRPSGRRKGTRRAMCPQECRQCRAALHDSGHRAGLTTRDLCDEDFSHDRGLVNVRCGRSSVVKSEMSARGHEDPVYLLNWALRRPPQPVPRLVISEASWSLSFSASSDEEPA